MLIPNIKENKTAEQTEETIKNLEIEKAIAFKGFTQHTELSFMIKFFLKSYIKGAAYQRTRQSIMKKNVIDESRFVIILSAFDSMCCLSTCGKLQYMLNIPFIYKSVYNEVLSEREKKK